MSRQSVRITQVLTLMLAVPMTVGSIMFSLVSPDHHEAAWKTWTFAPVAFACGIALLALVPRLSQSAGQPAIRRRALVVLGITQLFSVVKLIAFGESAAILFLVLGTVVLVRIALPQRPMRVIPGS